MKAIRANGATYRDIGGEVGMYARTVQRILVRGCGAKFLLSEYTAHLKQRPARWRRGVDRLLK